MKDIKADSGVSADEGKIITALTSFKNEADSACTERMLQNLENFDTYHLKQNFEHKKKGQSKEFLAKQFMAVEQITSFIKQGLADLGNEWYSLDYSDGVESPLISKDTVKLLLDRQLEKADFYNALGDGLKCGLLGSLMIAKVHTRYVSKPKYVAKKTKSAERSNNIALFRTKDKVCELAIDIVSPKDFRPDPSGRGLYLMHDIEMDLHTIRGMVKSKENPEGIFDEEAVEWLASDLASIDKDFKAARESGQNVAMQSYRKRVTVTEFWGTILDAEGNVMYENVVCAMANNRKMIRMPDQNPFWHGEHPFVVSPIVRVPHSVWHKALMDAPTKHNRAQNEIYNLILDSGIMSVFGIKQLRTDWLSDASLIDDGIAPGQTLEVNSQCPPGQKVLERVDTSDMSAEALQVYNLTNAEFQQSAMTNDLRLGVLPSRQVKATEIVESSQSITGMLNGVAKDIESQFIRGVLQKSWMTVCQNIDDFDDSEVQKLLGPQIAAQIKNMSRAERFADTVNGLTFNVFGITNTMNKQKDFRRITALLQTISGNEVLTEAFAEIYSYPKLLTEIIKALDVNTEKLKLDDVEKMMQQKKAMQPPAPGGTAPAAGSGAGPNMQSQTPQVASAQSGPIANAKFPTSPGTVGLGNGQ